MTRRKSIALLFSLAGSAWGSATCLDGGGAGAKPDAGSCDELRGRANAEILDAEAQVSDAASCSADRDCVYAYDMLSCTDLPPCGYAITNEAGLAAIEDAKSRVAATICPPFRDAGCSPQIIPPCSPPALVPYCDAGRCGGKPIGGDGG